MPAPFSPSNNTLGISWGIDLGTNASSFFVRHDQTQPMREGEQKAKYQGKAESMVSVTSKGVTIEHAKTRVKHLKTGDLSLLVEITKCKKGRQIKHENLPCFV